MTDFERLTVVFPEPMAQQLRAAVDAGEYASTSEAVQDAVRLWSARRQLREQDIEWLRQAWDAGKASGTHGPADLGELRHEARTRLERAGKDASRAG